MESPQIGPIRGLLTRSRQDVSKLDHEMSSRRGNVLEYSISNASDNTLSRTKTRPMSAFQPMSMDLTDGAASLHRTRSVEDISLEKLNSRSHDYDEEEGDIIPLGRTDSARSNSECVFHLRSGRRYKFFSFFPRILLKRM